MGLLSWAALIMLITYNMERRREFHDLTNSGRAIPRGRLATVLQANVRLASGFKAHTLAL